MLLNLFFCVSLKCQNEGIVWNGKKVAGYENLRKLWKYNFSLFLYSIFPV